MSKIDELMYLLKKAEAREKKEEGCSLIALILTIIGVVVVVAGVAFAVYKFISSRKCCKDEAEDDFEDSYDGEDTIEVQINFPEEAKEASAEEEACEEAPEEEAPAEEACEETPAEEECIEIPAAEAEEAAEEKTE